MNSTKAAIFQSWITPFVLTICALSVPVHAQPDPHAIWEQLLKANGKGDFPPELVVDNLGNRGPAYYSKRTVYLEETLPALLDSALGHKAESALSYVLAHELAHHNSDHICSHFIRRGLKGTETGLLLKDPDRRRDKSRLNEAEADEKAGLYGHIAGYQTLESADTTLSLIYAHYDIPDSLPGYPSLNERKTIAVNAQNQLNQVALVYDMAWMTCALGMYSTSSSLTETILKEIEYNAPEMYELLALAEFLEAVELLSKEYPKIRLWNWPIQLSHETNARSSKRDVAPDHWQEVNERMTVAEKWAAKGLELKSNSAQHEGLLTSIRFLIEWSKDPEGHIPSYGKSQPDTDIESNLKALSHWILKKDNKAVKILEQSNQLASKLNLKLIAEDLKYEGQVQEVQCNRLKADQNQYHMFRGKASEQVMIGSQLVFSRERMDGAWDVQFKGRRFSPRILQWEAPLESEFCWGFKTGKTSIEEVFSAFSGSAFRQLSLEQGSFIGFPKENLAFQFGPNGLLRSISWKAM